MFAGKTALHILTGVLVAVVLAWPVAALGAQTPAEPVTGPPNVLRGTVTDDSGQLVVGAIVTATRAPDRQVQSDTTKADGRYLIRFEQGSGDYLVAVARDGFNMVRRRVTARGGEQALVADFRLVPVVVSQLKAVRVVARPTTPSPTDPASPFTSTGGGDNVVDGAVGALAPGAKGDPVAAAGTLSNVTITPNGAAALGVGGEQAQVNLNGLAFGGGALPRALNTTTTVATTPYDITRGGVSGASINIGLAPGQREFTQKNLFLTLTPGAVQGTDAIGRETGARASSLQFSAGFDGEISPDRWTLNGAAQYTRSASDPATVVTASDPVLRAVGLSRDSVARALGIAIGVGAPVGGLGRPTAVSQELSLIGRFDRTLAPRRTLAITSALTLASRENELLDAGRTASTARESREVRGTLQVEHQRPVGDADRWLLDHRTGFNVGWRDRIASSAGPEGQVLIPSLRADGTSDAGVLSLGASSASVGRRTTYTAETNTEIARLVGGEGTHRLQGVLWARADGLANAELGNAAGRFFFPSLGALDSNRAASFTRTLAQPERRALAWNTAFGIGDLWTIKRGLQLMVGARVEGGGVADRPAYNARLDSALGLRTDVAIGAWRVTPRVAFTWILSGQNSLSSSENEFGRVFSGPSGTIRGGFGAFRGVFSPALAADAAAGTGLANATSELRCAGAAVPTVNWPGYGSTAGIPTACAAGAPSLFELAPAITVLDPRWAPATNWRGTLRWDSRLGDFKYSLEGQVALNRQQPSRVDVNLSGVPRFSLTAEGGRPVLVDPSAIDSVSGALTVASARRDQRFGAVTRLGSDRSGRAEALTLTLSPLNLERAFWSLGYTYGEAHDDARGFDGTTAALPGTLESAAADVDVRHQLVLQGGLRIPNVVFTGLVRLQSGLPFTPRVDGDINGDGLANDRPFAPLDGPGARPADVALRQQLDALYGSATSEARACLDAFRGGIAGRNSCRGPWRITSNLRADITLPLGPRFNALRMSLNLENPVAAIDYVVNGGNPRGWGGASDPDDVLLVKRGFDPVAQAFRYSVNPRFGDTRPGATLRRDPFRLSLDVSFNPTAPFEQQQLDHVLRRGRAMPEVPRLTEDSLLKRWRGPYLSLFAALYDQSDSLLLAPSQLRALNLLERAQQRLQDSVWKPVATELAALPAAYNPKTAFERVARADTVAWDAWSDQMPQVRAVLTPLQFSLLPESYRGVLLAKRREYKFTYYGQGSVSISRFN